MNWKQTARDVLVEMLGKSHERPPSDEMKRVIHKLMIDAFGAPQFALSVNFVRSAAIELCTEVNMTLEAKATNKTRNNKKAKKRR